MGVQLANSIYSVLLSAYLAAVIPLLVLLIRHRHIQPIRGRGWVLTTIATLGGIMMFIVVCFRQPDPSIFPCTVYVLSSNLYFSLFFLPFIFRAFKVIYIQYVTLVTSDDQEGAKRVIYDRKKRFSDKCNVFFYLVAVLISIAVGLWMVYYIGHTHSGIEVIEPEGNATVAPVVVVNGTTPDVDTDATLDMMHIGCAFGGEFVPFALVSAGYVAIFVICYVLLRRIKEDLAGSCRELRWCLTLWIPCTIAFFVCNLWKPLFRFDDVIPFSSWILVMIAGTNMISLLQPVMQTYSPVTGSIVDRMTERAQTTTYERVGNILKDPVAREIFHQWMIQRAPGDAFYFEFLKDVRVYKQRGPQERWKYSKQIKNNYLEKGSPSCITDNVIPQHLGIFTNAWSACNKTQSAPAVIFDQIAADICKFLQEHRMPEFMRSDMYRNELMSQAAQYHATIDAYQDHGMVDVVE